jgi:uncharacterized repeat protein (TIGR04138 family)
MATQSLEEKILTLRKRDRRYARFAYDFVLEALDYTISRAGRRGRTGENRHVGGRELLEGIREMVADQFGPLGKLVLNHWGVTRTEDVGEIVFNLIDIGLLNRRPEDTRLDFADGYDFEVAFERRRAPRP